MAIWAPTGSKRSILSFVLPSAMLLGACETAAAQCTPHWVETFPVADLDGSALALLADETGPNPPHLYVGGDFSIAGPFVANGIASWDGTSWSTLGSGVFASSGGYARVQALALFDDDGAGPHPTKLYAAGRFETAGGVAADGIAAWDGATWSALSSGISGTSPFVNALFVFDDDGPGPHPSALYVGGSFTTAGGVTANGIAKWNGSTWSALDSGTHLPGPAGGVVNALAFFDDDGAGPHLPALYAGGRFSSVGNITTKGLARWDGTSWSPVGGGMTDPSFFPYVSALIVHDDDGPGPNPPALYAGGYFGLAGGMSVHHIAKWDGLIWSPVGSGVEDYNTPSVSALGVFDEGNGAKLYAGGNFAIAGGVSVNRIACWDGSGWSALTTGIVGSVVNALGTFDPDGLGPLPRELFVGGNFTQAGGVGLHGIAAWDGAAWAPPVSNPTITSGPNDSVRTLAVFDDDGAGPHDPALYAGGLFKNAGVTTLNGIGRWDGSAWSTLGSGMASGANPGLVWALDVLDDDGAGPTPPALYAGGTFTTAGGVNASNIARWNGSFWSALGLGTNGPVLALANFDDGTGPALYAGGSFTTAGGVSANRIAKWTGTAWLPLGSGLDSSVYALAVFDEDGPGPGQPALFAGGQFAFAGGGPASAIARWDGLSWSPVGGGMGASSTPSVRSLIVHDEDGAGTGLPVLIAGGFFTSAGLVGANTIAKWDGASWSSLGTGLGGPSLEYVMALGTFDDDGPGPHPSALYAGGSFTSANGIGANHIAKWNGFAWSGLDAGISGSPTLSGWVYALAAFDADRGGTHPASLFAGGTFSTAGGLPSSCMAEWSGCDSALTAFCFGDGTQATPCPCANSGTPGRGCDNSAATGGALLSASGTVTPDSVVLTSDGELANALSIFLQGTVSVNPLVFGDGVRCAGGSLKRLYVKSASGGAVTAPGAGDPSISAQSALLGDTIVSGTSRSYQVYYRDPNPTFCAAPVGNTWNVSSGIQVQW